MRIKIFPGSRADETSTSPDARETAAAADVADADDETRLRADVARVVVDAATIYARAPRLQGRDDEVAAQGPPRRASGTGSSG